MSSQAYGDDIEAGDEIGPLIKTPHLEQVRAFLSVWNPQGGSDLSRGDFRSRFLDPEAAARDGLPGPIVPGPMTHAFLGQLLTDWAGPAGRLDTLEVNFRRPVHHNVELKCIGLITDKEADGDTTKVRIDVFIEDPRGDRPVQGVAEVTIPSRA